MDKQNSCFLRKSDSTGVKVYMADPDWIPNTMCYPKHYSPTWSPLNTKEFNQVSFSSSELE